RHFTELYAFLDTILATRTTGQWLDLLQAADIPFAPVNSLDDLLDDPHLNALGFWRRVEHPTEGTLMQTGLPVHFSRTPAGVTRHAPSLGEHTDELLGCGDAPRARSKKT
ncbi:MAG: CoA transferase, partial [Burkholderiaceae bacterium]|nr:CoA transferase [Burkholderiaceae bacterium]